VLVTLNPPVAPRVQFSLHGPDGELWQVSGYHQARAQAFLDRTIAPKPRAAPQPKPKTVAELLSSQEASDSPGSAPAPPPGFVPDDTFPLRDDEADHADIHAQVRNAAMGIGVALAVYVAGFALFRTLRWIALGFLVQGPRERSAPPS
jgi:hypothetical protein